MENQRKIDSEAYRELMIYNRELIEESTELKFQIKDLKNRLEYAEVLVKSNSILPNKTAQSNGNFFKGMDTNVNGLFDYLDSVVPPIEQFDKSEQDIPAANVQALKQVKMVKKGTQVLVDINTSNKFIKVLNSEGLSLTQVCRSMMLFFIDRARYRNIIISKVTNRNWISNNERDTHSFAFTYPEKLGVLFTHMLKAQKILQYQAFEEMMLEFSQNQGMRKLIREYITTVNQRY